MISEWELNFKRTRGRRYKGFAEVPLDSRVFNAKRKLISINFVRCVDGDVVRYYTHTVREMISLMKELGHDTPQQR